MIDIYDPELDINVYIEGFDEGFRENFYKYFGDNLNIGMEKRKKEIIARMQFLGYTPEQIEAVTKYNLPQ